MYIRSRDCKFERVLTIIMINVKVSLTGEIGESPTEIIVRSCFDRLSLDDKNSSLKARSLRVDSKVRQAGKEVQSQYWLCPGLASVIHENIIAK